MMTDKFVTLGRIKNEFISEDVGAIVLGIYVTKLRG